MGCEVRDFQNPSAALAGTDRHKSLGNGGHKLEEQSVALAAGRRSVFLIATCFFIYFVIAQIYQ